MSRSVPSGGAYRGNAYHGGYNHYNHGYGSSVIIGLGFGLGGYYGGGYRGGYYPYDYGYSFAPSYAEPRYAYYQAVQQAPVEPTIPPNAAAVRVYVLDPDAKVWFDGAATRQVGTDRLFHTTLTESATYRIRASWVQAGKEMIQERVVPVSPGQISVADFTRPVSEEVPPPPPLPKKEVPPLPKQ